MQKKISELKKKANQVRKNVLEMIVSAGKGHIGGAFSCTDILTTLFYGEVLRFDPSDENWKERDRFILSKGHSATALYSILADLGYFPRSELQNYGKPGCMLGGHPDKKIPGIEVDTGSLGQGFGVAAGLALSAKKDHKAHLIVTVLGDGECHEGSIWETAMFASHHKLNNLIAIVDRNGQCATDFIKNSVDHSPLEEKWRAFGWETDIVNGHSFEEMLEAFSQIRSRTSNKPLMVIADTIKGKGVSFMEGKVEWHHSVPKGEQVDIARKELEEELTN